MNISVASMDDMAIEVRPARQDEAPQLRRLRLEMLLDSPSSFAERLDRVSGWDQARWEERLRSMTAPDAVLFVAVDGERWVGQAGGRIYGNYVHPRVYLLAVYVSPEQRGLRLVNRLVGEVEAWAVTMGHRELFLDVHEDAAPARKSYSRMGFVATGASLPYVNDETRSELELVKWLTTRR